MFVIHLVDVGLTGFYSIFISRIMPGHTRINQAGIPHKVTGTGLTELKSVMQQIWPLNSESCHMIQVTIKTLPPFHISVSQTFEFVICDINIIIVADTR